VLAEQAWTIRVERAARQLSGHLPGRHATHADRGAAGDGHQGHEPCGDPSVSPAAARCVVAAVDWFGRHAGADIREAGPRVHSRTEVRTFRDVGETSLTVRGGSV